MTLKNDLSADLNTYLDNKGRPIFHRIKFAKVSFYLTKSTFHDLAVSQNEHGHYRIFSWDDWRSRKLLGLELSEDNPVHGKVRLIGKFEPTEDDLENVQYHSSDGRRFYRSAKATVEGKADISPSKSKEQSSNWSDFRMKEIIPTGVQGKAIYGEGNFIIDGPAGTGKSTTALQRIKLLEKHYGVDPKAVLVIVKNENLVPEFNALLQSINVDNVGIQALDELISHSFSSAFRLSNSVNHWAWDFASTICDHLSHLAKEVDYLFNHQFKPVGINDNTIRKLFSRDSIADGLFNSYLDRRKEFIQVYREHCTKVSSINKSLDSAMQDRIEKYKETLLKRRAGGRLSALLGRKPNFKDARFTENEQMKIRDQEKSLRKLLESPLKDENRKFSKRSETKKKNLQQLLNQLRSRVCEREFWTRYAETSDKYELLGLHIRKFMRLPATYHTVIVDEAQNFSAEALHVAWLHSDNVILTGDEMQANEPDGIGSWGMLGKIKRSFCDEDDLKVFTLENNFRQTYELGSCSHNFRQLALGRSIVDISSEYFENQKGFSTPQLALIRGEKDFCRLTKSKIELAQKRLGERKPVVILYENVASLRRLSQVLDGENISYGYDGDESKSVMFVSVSDIGGRSFPILLGPLIDSTDEKALYVMLSRARFDLCLFASADKSINEKIQSLLESGVMSYHDIT